jgi:hypothetical protein
MVATNRTIVISGFFVLTLISACSGRLQILSDTGKNLPGVPVATYELWVEEGVYTKLAKGGTCDTSTTFQKVASIPTGPKYFVMVDPSAFSKTSVDVKLNSDGALSELSFNSESNVPDALTGAANVLKALPALGIAGAGAPAPPGVTPCDSGEVIKKITKYDEWLRAH